MKVNMPALCLKSIHVKSNKKNDTLDDLKIPKKTL